MEATRVTKQVAVEEALNSLEEAVRSLEGAHNKITGKDLKAPEVPLVIAEEEGSVITNETRAIATQPPAPELHLAEALDAWPDHIRTLAARINENVSAILESLY